MELGSKEQVEMLSISSMIRIGFSENTTSEHNNNKVREGKGVGHLKEQLVQRPDVRNKAGAHEGGLGWRCEFDS